MSGSKKKQFSIKYISEYIDASIDGDVDLEINKISTIEDAEHGSITFLANLIQLIFLQEIHQL